MTQEQIDEAKKKAGSKELHQIDVEHEGETLELCVTAPSQIEWTKFNEDLEKAKGDITFRRLAHVSFIQLIAKHPSAGEIGSFFDRKYLSIGKTVDEITELVGENATIKRKKL